MHSTRQPLARIIGGLFAIVAANGHAVAAPITLWSTGEPGGDGFVDRSRGISGSWMSLPRPTGCLRAMDDRFKDKSSSMTLGNDD